MKNEIKEIVADYNGRIKNPLIATFIFVWLYKHWQLVYSIIYLDKTINLQDQIETITKYIHNNDGWKGMLLSPILYSFGSLIAFYLLATCGQTIRVFVGKRLSAAILAKVDTGTYALSSELKKEQKTNQELHNNLTLLKKTNTEQKEQIEDLEKETSSLANELKREKLEKETAKADILSNRKFKEEYELLLLYQLSLSRGIKLEMTKPELHKSYFTVLEGTWQVTTPVHYTKNSGPTTHFAIEGNKVADMTGNPIATLENLVFDKKFNVLEFEMAVGKVRKKYVLIRTNINEFVGFRDNEFCFFQRDQ